MNKITTLETLTMAALVSIHNQMADNPVKKFSDRAKAAERINRLAKEKGVNVKKAFSDDGSPIAAEAPAKPATKKTAKAPKEVKVKGPVIRTVAEELLLQVVGKDDDGRPQGRPYSDVLDAIHQQFPEAATSVACLRWYAVRMRERGDKVPNRPRAKPEVAAAVEG